MKYLIFQCTFTENIHYSVSLFICSLISIYIYSSALNLYMMSKNPGKVKKLIN